MVVFVAVKREAAGLGEVVVPAARDILVAVGREGVVAFGVVFVKLDVVAGRVGVDFFAAAAAEEAVVAPNEDFFSTNGDRAVVVVAGEARAVAAVLGATEGDALEVADTLEGVARAAAGLDLTPTDSGVFGLAAAVTSRFAGVGVFFAPAVGVEGFPLSATTAATPSAATAAATATSAVLGSSATTSGARAATLKGKHESITVTEHNSMNIL